MNDYDGDQKRIRKTTPDKETLYFGGLVFGEVYERVSTKKGPSKIEHRYYVNSPEYENLKAEYQNLQSTPNKTPEVKAAMEKTQRAMKKAKQEMDFSGENHSQRAKGHH